ncbi:MAG TPA: metallophosphoesterase, partial [Gallionella sp.]|nr:metallophosphoesterase [Gallionella sp.]
MKIVHISDLHVSNEMHHQAESTHSLELLKGIQLICQEEMPDYLVVTGDITDLGDGQSLVNAREWIFNTVPIGGGERIGLQLPPEKVFLIPGNHDAFNVTTPKSPIL